MHIPRPIRSPITCSPKDESARVEACPSVHVRDPCGFTRPKPCGRYAFTRLAKTFGVVQADAGGFTLPKQRERFAFTLPKQRERSRAFTLVELIVVIALISTLMVLVAPALTAIKTASDVTSAAYTIKDALEQARTYAMAHHTYVWIGFYEEPAGQPSTNPATPGTGRIVISTIASADGTTVYNPRSLAAIDPTRVTQFNKLVKVEGTHLATFPDGSGTGDTFDSRPAAIY
jgi:prepilin-type N-terminal cleavage/methylation domain-containing protein